VSPLLPVFVDSQLIVTQPSSIPWQRTLRNVRATTGSTVTVVLMGVSVPGGEYVVSVAETPFSELAETPFSELVDAPDELLDA
jgi:hypothetical protein